MTTNYCREYLEDLAGTEDEDLKLPHINSYFIKRAVKFRLPNRGVILDVVNPDKITAEDIQTKMPSVISHLRLPYDEIVLEYNMPNPANPQKNTSIMILASNTSEGVAFRLISRIVKQGVNYWSDFAVGGIVTGDFEVRYGVIDGNEDAQDGSGMVVFYNAYVLLSFIAALQCSNVVEGIDPAPPKLNKSRAKKGKEPLFDYKTLTIDTKKQVTKIEGQQAGEPKHTKREHLRRGHIRRYENKTIWVNPCVVGDSEKGRIKKDYLVI